MHVAGNFQKVFNWMSLFKQTVRVEPTVHITEAEKQLRIKLMKEELLDELIPAIERGDLVEIADGIVDLLYVTYGTAVAYGIDADIVFEEAHKANMRKAGDDGLPIVREDGKILKNPNWTPPNIGAVLLRLGWQPEATDTP